MSTVTTASENPTSPAANASERSLDARLRDAIPEHCHTRSDRIAAWYVGRTVVCYVLVMVALALSHALWLIVLLWAAAAACVSGMFVLAHDAAHQALFRSPTANSIAARLLMLPELHVFSGWVMGHNRLHHRHTARRNVDFVWHPVTPVEYQRMPRLARARHRIEWSVFGSGLYYAREIWWNHMIRQTPPVKQAQQVRRDRRLVLMTAIVAASGAAIFGALTTGSALHALLTPVKLFVVPWIVFNVLIGWAVYVHHIGPTIPWRDGQPTSSTLDSTTILRAPWPLDVVWFNIFLHVAHHLDPRLPCYRLRDATAALLAAHPELVVEQRMRFRDYWTATRTCKVYDFEQGKWLRYRDLRGLSSGGITPRG